MTPKPSATKFDSPSLVTKLFTELVISEVESSTVFDVLASLFSKLK